MANFGLLAPWYNSRRSIECQNLIGPWSRETSGGGLRSYLEATGSVRHPLHDALQASGSSHVRHRSKQHDLVHSAVRHWSGWRVRSH